MQLAHNIEAHVPNVHSNATLYQRMEWITFQESTMSPQYHFPAYQDSLLKLILHRFASKSNKACKASFGQQLVTHDAKPLGGVVALEHGNHVLSYHGT